MVNDIKVLLLTLGTQYTKGITLEGKTIRVDVKYHDDSESIITIRKINNRMNKENKMDVEDIKNKIKQLKKQCTIEEGYDCDIDIPDKEYVEKLLLNVFDDNVIDELNDDELIYAEIESEYKIRIEVA